MSYLLYALGGYKMLNGNVPTGGSGKKQTAPLPTLPLLAEQPEHEEVEVARLSSSKYVKREPQRPLTLYDLARIIHRLQTLGPKKEKS